MEAVEVRSMLLELVVSIAHRLIEASGTYSLTRVSILEHQEAGDVKWHIQVEYDSEREEVTIQAIPVNTTPESVMEALGFVSAGDAYSFCVPTAWLP